MVNLKTPLVMTTVLIVLGMGVVRLVLVPEEWLSSLIALAFLPLSITDKLGITVQDAESDMRSLAVLLPAIIATAADLLSARLEHQAEQDSEDN